MNGTLLFYYLSIPSLRENNIRDKPKKTVSRYAYNTISILNKKNIRDITQEILILGKNRYT